MNVYSDTQVHRDHLQWAEERAMWHDDVRVWEEEVEELEAKLKQITAALVRQKHELQVHSGVIRVDGEHDARHEHALAEYERDGNEERMKLLANAHNGETCQQTRHRQRHEEIKATQRRLIAELRALIPIANRLPPARKQAY